ncbi:MAG: septum formation initiator family protein [Spirochaetota bacterium]
MASGDRITLIILAGFLCAVYFFVFGESGLIERSRLASERENLRVRIERLGDENAALQRLYEKHGSGRLLREEAHRAGFIENGERVVFLRPLERTGAGEMNKRDTPVTGAIETSHLRILWIVVSMLALLYYFSRFARDGVD